MSNDTYDQIIVAANSGFNQIRYVPPGVGKIVAQAIKEAARVFPVIGWAISGDERTPITPHDIAPVEGELRVLMLPGGVIIDAAGTQYRGFDDWAMTVATNWRAQQPPYTGPTHSLGPIRNPDPQPAKKAAWLA